MQSVVVLEVNEVPLKIFRKYADENPESAIADLLGGAKCLTTVADDVEADMLYPSQTWASFNTGVEYKRHNIHWYADPKPDDPIFYWHKIACDGYSVGLINTLHASPTDIYAKENFQFLIPDCFAQDEKTIPGEYSAFQRVNLALTRKNSRVSSLWGLSTEVMDVLKNFRTMGLNWRSLTFIGITLLQIVAKLANRERLRNLQFPMLSEIFLDLVRKHSPDLAILFTNHIAAAQHRYWYAHLPEEFDIQLYDAEWVSRYKTEVDAALSLFDKYLRLFMAMVNQRNSILVVCSSMGQQANQSLTKEAVQGRNQDYRLDHPHKFLEAVQSNSGGYVIGAGMVPQYSFIFEDVSNAISLVDTLTDVLEGAKGISYRVDRLAETVTLSVQLDTAMEIFELGGRKYRYSELGFAKFDVTDHHAGRHHPEGSLIIYNDRHDRLFSSGEFNETLPISYLKYAPEMLRYFAESGRQAVRNVSD